jgi:hypothetical protein
MHQAVGPKLDAWEKEPPLHDETRFTPWAQPGWSSWNGMSPEKEFCDFVVGLVRLTEPRRLIETGVGQGFLARRLKPVLGNELRLLCFEESDDWRDALAALAFFDGETCALSKKGTPSESELAEADLCILDSAFRIRFEELRTWWRVASSRAMVVLHDVSKRHDEATGHAASARLIEELGIQGFFLQNPRGGFVGVKP